MWETILICVVLVLAYIAMTTFIRFLIETPKTTIEQEDPHWEVVPVTDAGDIVGYKIRWSEPDSEGRYLWVAHYMSGEEISLSWCEQACHSHCQRLVREHRFPWEWDRYTPESNT